LLSYLIGAQTTTQAPSKASTTRAYPVVIQKVDIIKTFGLPLPEEVLKILTHLSPIFQFLNQTFKPSGSFEVCILQHHQ